MEHNILDDKGKITIDEKDLELLRKEFKEESLERRIVKMIHRLYEMHKDNPQMVHDLLRIEMEHKLSTIEFEKKYKRNATTHERKPKIRSF
jgi:hypothetical protein